jgi:tight adherence protein C
MPEVTQLNSVPWWSALMSGWGGPLVGFVVAATAFFLVARVLLRRPLRKESRLEQIQPESAPQEGPRTGPFGSWTHALAAQIPEPESERQEFKLLLRQAGMYAPHTSETLHAWRFVLLAAPLVVAGVWAILADSGRTSSILIAGGVTAAVLTVLPRMYVFFRRRKRMRRIRESLPDTLDMLNLCISGGLELGESLEHVAKRLTGYPECAQELLLLKRHAELGNLRRALEDFARRVDLPETNLLAGLLLRGSHLGTELVSSLAEQAEHLRVARRQSAASQANKTPVKLVLPIMFCFAPAALILLTAPAVIQLRDFLTGRPAGLRQDMSAARVVPPASVTLGPQTIVDTLQNLNQSQTTAQPGRNAGR